MRQLLSLLFLELVVVVVVLLLSVGSSHAKFLRPSRKLNDETALSVTDHSTTVGLLSLISNENNKNNNNNMEDDLEAELFKEVKTVLSQNQPTTTINNNNNLSAILHIGPMKTGTTSIQRASWKFNEGLQDDGFEHAPLNALGLEPNNFVGCFYPPTLRTPMYTCYESQLQETLNIATQRQKNLFLSTEFLPEYVVNVPLLKEFLQPFWNDIYVVLYYRRFFDWLVSYRNQGVKFQPVEERETIVDFITAWYQQQKLGLERRYTVQVADRYRQYFDNVHVVNMYDMLHGDSTEEFFCGEATSHLLPHTCDTLHELGEDKDINRSEDLVYSELAYYALQMKLWNEDATDLSIEEVATLVRKRQENELLLTKYDFPFKTCLEQQAMDALLEKSLEFEQTLFPEYYQTHGEAEIRQKFADYSTTKLCSVNAKLVVENDEGWQAFFRNIA